MADLSLEQCAVAYSQLCGISVDLQTPLGHGTDGSVWRSNRKTAVKALARHRNYILEKLCYQRFKDEGVFRIEGFAVPELVGANDDLRVVEITIVTAPFILDFAKVSIDQPPDFDPEVIEEAERQNEERFGTEYWAKVRILL